MLFQYLSYLHSLLSCGSEFPLHGCIIMVLYKTTEQYGTIKQNKIGLPVLTWKDKCQAVLSKQGKLQISIHIMSLYFVKKKKKRIKINTIKWISMLICTENSWKKYTQLQTICKTWVNEWVKLLSYVWLFATPWTVAPQAPPSMGFSRQEYWSGLPFPSPGDLPDPGTEPRSPALQADALPSELKGLEAVKWTWPIKAILMVLHRNDL